MSLLKAGFMTISFEEKILFLDVRRGCSMATLPRTFVVPVLGRFDRKFAGKTKALTGFGAS